MYHPAFGKPFKPRKARTNQLHSQETTINLKFQRHSDGHVFEDTRPDWIREHRTTRRPDSASRLGQWKLVWVPHRDNNPREEEKFRDAVSTSQGVWLKGRLIQPKNPTMNTVASLLSTGLSPLYAASEARVGKGIYYGDEIRPSSSRLDSKKGQTLGSTGASRSSAYRANEAPAAKTRHHDPSCAQSSHDHRPHTSCGLRSRSLGRGHTQKNDADEDSGSAVERMSLCSSHRSVALSSAGSRVSRRAGSAVSGKSSVATLAILERLR
jgi:hypothetical protein